jgi:hypothetical protein
MKISSVILSVSIAANVALLAWLVLPKNVEPKGATVPTQTMVSSAPRATDERRLTAPAEPLWERLDADGDLNAVLSRLRAAGFPPKVVRAILTALVAEQFDAERYKIDEVALHTPYWKMWPNSYQDPKVGPALRKLQRDQQEVIKRLLGETGADEATDESRAWQQLSMGNLSPEKLDQLNRYLATHNEKLAQAFAAIRGGLLPTDREKLTALDKSLREDLGKFLTPDEVAEYNLRSGNAANQLKWMLNPFRATEDEYRTIFPLYQSYVDQFPAALYPSERPDTSVDAARKIAQEALIAQLASTLGPERAEDLRVALDPKYASLNRLVSRLDLPLTAAKQVFDAQQDIQQRAAALRDNTALPPNERADRLTALTQEASAKISAALGGSGGFDVYKQNGGQWLLDLSRPPKT